MISALESMTGAPVDAISFDDKPVSLYWAKQLRKANGETVKDDTSVSDNQTSTGATVTDAMLRQWEQEMIVRINEERAKVGAPALVQDKNLMQWAQYWAKHLTTEFRHSVWSDNTAYAKLVGISANDIDSGENIGTTNFSDPVTSCMTGFYNSEGHRRTMLNPEYNRVGIGFAVSGNGDVYCAQEFMK